MTLPTAKELQHSALIDASRKLLEQLPQDQREFFFYIWPEWPEKDPRPGACNDHKAAYDLLCRTIKSNNREVAPQ